MNLELEQKIINYISDVKEEVYVDYRDLENLEHLVAKYDIQDDFLMELDECYYESYDEIVNHWIDEVFNEFNLDNDDSNLYDEIQEIVREHLIIEFPYDRFLDYEIKANVICDFYKEGDTDFTDNGWLKWLMNSQGYRVKDYPAIKKLARYRWLQPCDGGTYYYDDNKLKDGEVEAVRNSGSKFLKSLLQECENQYIDYMRALTFLTRMSIREYFAWKENRLKKIVFNKNVECGLFNCWQGCGSVLEIALEKEVTVNAKNIYRIQIETPRVKGQGYTVDEVYGLCGSCWKENTFYINGA